VIHLLAVQIQEKSQLGNSITRLTCNSFSNVEEKDYLIISYIFGAGKTVFLWGGVRAVERLCVQLCSVWGCQVDEYLTEPKFIVILWELKPAQEWGCPSSIKCLFKDIRSALFLPLFHALLSPISCFGN
jgi:hypothetical protein